MHDSFFKRRGHSRSLRHACGTALAAITLSFGLPASAQEHPNGLVMDSVTPALDSAFISEARARLDEVRRTQRRPTVAIVLSGGGAKGAAQTGALKYLEEIGMPVDFICGTSIGGLIGGLYSVGYRSEDIRELFLTANWSKLLTDRIHPRYYPIHSRLYKETYLLSIPFHYGDKQSDDKPGARLHIGAGDKNFISSLPTGYAYGFNVNNLLASMTVGYQDSLSFASLPIPFACVASDLVSCKAKNWGAGDLKTAMRSTMSIPGLFDPVRTEGMMLVDGGTRNNFPTDIAKAVGADYIIGIELGDERPQYDEDVKGIGNIVSQFIAMLGADSYKININSSDVLIKPDLKGYNMLSFKKAAVDTMLSRGYEAAKGQAVMLDALKARVGESSDTESRKAVNIGKSRVQLGSVAFEGISDKESRLLMGKIDLNAGSYVSSDELENAMSIIQATGAFNSVTYSLYGSESPYALVFHCIPGPTHQMGLGVRMDTEEWVSVLFNLGLNTHKLAGSKLDFTLKLGPSQYLSAKYSLDLENAPTINAEAYVGYYRADVGSALDNSSMNLAYWTHKEKVYVSNIKWTKFDFQVGFKHQYYNLPEAWLFGFDSGSASPAGKTNLFSAYAEGLVYTFDNKYYPTRGVNMSFGYSYDFHKANSPKYEPVHIAWFNGKRVLSTGKIFAFIPSFHARFVMGNNDPAQSNYIGGSIPGRYIDQQIPFVGMCYAYQANDFLMALNLDFRFNPIKNLYISALAGAFKSNNSIQNLVLNSEGIFCGAGLEAGYNTLGGPIKLRLNWNTLTHRTDYYISLGFDF